MVDIIGRAKVIVESQVDKSSIDETGGKIGAGLKRGALIGGAALVTLAGAGFKAFQSFEKAEASSRKLTRVLDNMGEGKAAPAVEKLADELRRLTGIDDDVIKGGQTILATFTAVAASAGEVGGTFDRATRAAVDMSSVFGSVEGASRVLGKALSDPAKAATLLRRSNVILNDEQKKLIDSFLAAGDAAGAQDVILDALEDRYKGTAEEASTASQKISEAMGEAGEAVGNVVDTLFGGKDPEGGGKPISSRIDDVTDALNRFAESEGFKEFSKNLNEAEDTGIGAWAEREGNRMIEQTGKDLLFLSTIPERLDKIKADIDDGGLWDGVSDQLENAEKAVGRAFGRLKTRVGDAIDDIKETGKEWGSAGRKLIGDFLKGFASGPVPFQLGQKVKDAINKALPNTITFFGGRGGIPAITVDVPQFAGGVRNFSGGLARVGENGPELVSLPSGSSVYSNSESNRMLAGSDGDTTVNNWNFYGPESLSAARRDEDWYKTYGTRFGAAAGAR